MDWQRCYVEGHTPWDKGTAHPGLVHALANLPATQGRVLVPGCGTGHDLLPWQRPGVTEVVGLDIAPSAVEAAKAKISGQTGASAILGDFFALPEEIGQFDWLWEHTCFCAIPPNRRADYAASAAAALRPGGHLLAIFFLNPWDPTEDQTQGPPYGVQPEELDAFFNPAFELLEKRPPTATYPGREGREELRLYKRRA